MQVGIGEGLSFDPNRPNWDSTGPRPLKWSAWYPTDDGPALSNSADSWFRSEPVIPEAALAPRRTPWPLILLSHGTGGVASGLGWLATRLARRGYVVLGVDHHGNTGSEIYRAEGFRCL
jgi:predicted dienelactone hydrolase